MKLSRGLADLSLDNTLKRCSMKLFKWDGLEILWPEMSLRLDPGTLNNCLVLVKISKGPGSTLTAEMSVDLTVKANHPTKSTPTVP